VARAKKRLLVLFGNQLFPNDAIAVAKPDVVFMAESESMCRRYAAHRHKLVLMLSSMRSKADALREAGVEVVYHALEESSGSWSSMLSAHLATRRYRDLVHFEIESPAMREELEALCTRDGLNLVVVQSPMFVTSRADFQSYRDGRKRLFMADFYRWQRKRLGVLIDDEGAPAGGKWSFDEENRKKLPKGLIPPPLRRPEWTQHTEAVVEMVDRLFPDHPGEARDFWLPTTEAQADEALQTFLDERLAAFGDYEDALSTKYGTIFHSVLSALLNIGLLTPEQVLRRTLEHAREAEVPLNSLEGFVRQVIGWREFIRGVWDTLPPSHWQQNFWGHTRELTPHWYEGTTGIPPLDDTIRRAQQTGYSHHIERLMVVGNLMLLCQVKPEAAYQWFMEMYVDSADWVMAPNVYGMALFSEGGAFTTKPYICGSNYLRKMSDYGKGPWCDIVDGLYWSFVDGHREFFASNPRSKMMLRTLDRIDAARRDRIFDAAETFMATVTK
jgi:deoxyribodipyrimidine photolyase-related protein